MNKVYIQKLKDELDIYPFLDKLEWTQLFKSGERVILKPNFVAPRENSKGATTNLGLLEAIVQKLQTLGCKPIICEMPGMEFDTREVFNYLKIWEFAEKHDIEVFIPEEKDFITIPVPNSFVLKKIKVPRIVLENKIVNVPILKTHVITQVTLGMKNLMGFCHHDTRKLMHSLGIHAAVADLNKVIKPTLTIIDAINSMEGDGAVYGNLKKTMTLIAGLDPFATDKIACDFMGVDYKDISYINLARNNVPIEIEGNIERHKFELPKQSKGYQFAYRCLYIIDFVFEKLFSVHFNTFLYKTGYFGTRPILEPISFCQDCRKCLEECPVGAISAKFTFDRKKCLRCLHCYDICPKKLIGVKGFSNPENYEKK